MESGHSDREVNLMADLIDSTSLTDEQRVRLAILTEAREQWRVEIDAFDLVNCCYWIATGSVAPAISTASESLDSARWSPTDAGMGSHE